jgi:hypothetical protein
MTAQQLFDLTVGVMGIQPENALSYTPTIIPQINMILAQTFNLENNNRKYLILNESSVITELTAIPVVTALGDTLTYQDNILRKVVVWGLAQLLALSDKDTVLAGFYETRYADAQRLESKFINMDVEDYFGTEE